MIDKVKILVVINRREKAVKKEKIVWVFFEEDGLRSEQLPTELKVNKRWYPYKGDQTEPSPSLRCLTRLSTQQPSRQGYFSLFYGRKELGVKMIVKDGRIKVLFNRDVLSTGTR